jgi:hypothetical protein
VEEILGYLVKTKLKRCELYSPPYLGVLEEISGDVGGVM